MKTDEIILTRINNLIELGENVLSTRRDPGPNIIGDDRVDSILAHQWVTSTQSLISNFFGEDSSHFKNFENVTTGTITYSNVVRAFGVLKAVKYDFENGYLENYKKLIEAEVFDDFIEQSKYLLDSGYYQAAAVIAGCVLEDSLRKLCDKNEIEVTKRPSMETMNSNLAKKGIYNKFIQKKLTALADLRNKAAHGKWEEFNQDDVDDMIKQIAKFLTDYVK